MFTALLVVMVSEICTKPQINKDAKHMCSFLDANRISTKHLKKHTT